jgi:hypothetical protein
MPVLATRPRRRALTAAAVTAGLLLAACGGSDRTDNASGASASGSTTQPTGAASEEAGDAAPFTVAESAYTLVPNGSGGYFVEWAAVLANPNAAHYGAFPTVTITARDAAGAVLGTDTQVLNGFPPGTSIAFASQIEADAKPAEVQVAYSKVDWYPTKTTAGDYLPFTASGVRWAGDQFSRDVVGELTNPWPAAVEQVAATALYRDADGTLVGGSTGYVDALPASGTVPFSIMDTSGLKKEPASIEVHAMPWSGLPDEWNQLAVG